MGTLHFTQLYCSNQSLHKLRIYIHCSNESRPDSLSGRSLARETTCVGGVSHAKLLVHMCELLVWTSTCVCKYPRMRLRNGAGCIYIYLQGMLGDSSIPPPPPNLHANYWVIRAWRSIHTWKILKLPYCCTVTPFSLLLQLPVYTGLYFHYTPPPRVCLRTFIFVVVLYAIDLHALLSLCLCTEG